MPNKIECQVIRLSDVKFILHKKVNISKVPYLEQEYFGNRDEQREIINATGKYKAIWERQQGRCFYCGQPILADQSRYIVPINITKSLTISNLAYVHSFCKDDEFMFLHTEQETNYLSREEVLSILQQLTGAKSNTETQIHHQFEALSEYFFNLELSPHTLSFTEIERLISKPLCKSARKYTSYWQNKKEKGISQCWLRNGYIIKNVNLDKEYVVFCKENTGISHLVIPKVLLTKKIPLDAKYEIENYLIHICKKYGLK